MKQTYTAFNLLQLIYGEFDVCEKMEIEYAMQNDLCLQDNYDELYKSYKELPKVKFSPSREALNNIIKYNEENLEPIC